MVGALWMELELDGMLCASGGGARVQRSLAGSTPSARQGRKHTRRCPSCSLMPPPAPTQTVCHVPTQPGAPEHSDAQWRCPRRPAARRG